MPPSREVILDLSRTTRFQQDALEKALRLVELLQTIGEAPYLKDRLALKGGTALNLFHLSMPRISVDLDFNYIGRIDRSGMEEERPAVKDNLQRVAGSFGYPVRMLRAEEPYAQTTWILPYAEMGVALIVLMCR